MSPSTGPVPPARPHHRFTDDGRRMREVLSYSRRGSRLTSRLQRAWDLRAADWVIPEEAVEDPAFDLASWFGRRAPLLVEIGSGIGEATVATAAARPDVDLLALEVWVPGVADTLARADEAGVETVRLLALDAAWVIEHLLAPDAIEEVHTWFPDPWHKTRHHKRRLVQPDFAAAVASRLRPGGVWRLATDWPEYADQMREVLDAEPGLEGGPVERYAGRPVTRFERKGLRAGRPVADLAYTRPAP